MELVEIVKVGGADVHEGILELTELEGHPDDLIVRIIGLHVAPAIFGRKDGNGIGEDGMGQDQSVSAGGVGVAGAEQSGRIGGGAVGGLIKIPDPDARVVGWINLKGIAKLK